MEIKLLHLLILLVILVISYPIKKIIYSLFSKAFNKPKLEWIKLILLSSEKYFLLWIFLFGLYLVLDFSALPLKIIHYLQKVLLISLVLSLALYAANTLVKLIDLYLHKKTEILFKVSLFEILIKVIIYSIAFILILSILGINIAPFLTTLGVAGLAVGLALKDTLGNFFAGLQILMARQIKPGDFIRLESGEEGYIEDINWRTTTIRLLSHNLLIIPNAKLAENILINYNLPSTELSVIIPVGISYQSNLEKVEKITLEVAKEFQQTHPRCVQDFEPVVRFQNFGDFSINLSVILRAKDVDSRFLVISDFIKKIYETYKKEGIEIPFPIRKVYLTKENN